MNEFIEIMSQRGKIMLCIDDCKFWKHRNLKSGEEKWRCENRKCPAILKTIGSGIDRRITFKQLQHNHEPERVYWENCPTESTY